MTVDEFVRNFGVLSGIITIIAMAVSIAVIVVSNSIGKRTLYAKTVSENRVRWLYKLRDMIYIFIKLSRMDDTCDKTLINIKNKIQLHYNKDEQAYLISLLDNIIIDKKNEGLKDDLIKYCQIVFKSEWEKVKKEAGEPLIKGISKKIKSLRKSKWYEKFWIWLCCIAIILLLTQGTTFKVAALPLFSNININLAKDIIIPIILSFIAAIIFWFVFNHLPDKKRYLKIRPKVEYNMYSVYINLFHYIDLTLGHNNYSPSFFQHKIRGGILLKEDIVLGLQNKCLNDSYLFDKNASLFVVIGNKLFEEANKINIEIDKLFDFNNYLSANEILLLEKIRTKLFKYNYENTPFTKIIEHKYTVKIPNLSYMADNIFDIYNLFLNLQSSLFRNTFFDRDIFLYLVQYYFYSNNYEECKKQIGLHIEEYQDCKELLLCYDFSCDYLLNRKNESYEKIESLFKNKINLVSHRDFLVLIINEVRAQELLKQYYTDSDIKYLTDIIKNEENLKANFINQALSLKEHYSQK